MGKQFLPEKGQHLVYLIHPQTRFALFQITDEAEAHPRPQRELRLREVRAFAPFFYESGYVGQSIPAWIGFCLKYHSYTRSGIKYVKNWLLYPIGYNQGQKCRSYTRSGITHEKRSTAPPIRYPP